MSRMGGSSISLLSACIRVKVARPRIDFVAHHFVELGENLGVSFRGREMGATRMFMKMERTRRRLKASKKTTVSILNSLIQNIPKFPFSAKSRPFFFFFKDSLLTKMPSIRAKTQVFFPFVIGEG